MTTLTPDETTEAEAMLAALRERGYVDIEQHGKLRPGVRVRHRSHQWPDAYVNGTGAVLALTQKPDSGWSQSWDMPDVEMIVVWDKPIWTSRLAQLAQYHVGLAEVSP